MGCPRMKPASEEASDDAVVFRVAQLFIGERSEGLTPAAIAEKVNHEFPRQRAVTLFELEDLARVAGQKNKHVILIARQCGICGRTRAEALQPLLANPGLKVFSTLVMDAATARELLQ